ncbi:MAG: flagellar filament capping protein FliD [Thermodesulfobacteriota bacterium]
MATISIGGLATGLDTNGIIEQLVALERRRAVTLLEDEQRVAQGRQSALGTLQGKVSALLGAVDALRDPASALARKATSSDETLVRATAGSGAITGTTEITVAALARGAIATSAAGKSSADATVAAGAGSFSFRLGSRDVQTVAVDGTTTLAGLAAAINGLGAGVAATVVNVGTSSAPDYRLRVASKGTGTSNDLTIVTDDTDLGVAVTQAAQNASFTVSGFATPFIREGNVVNDAIPGVTLGLQAAGGPVTIAVETDGDAVAADVQKVVDAFGDLVAFVAQQSEVVQDTGSQDRDVLAGPLAFDGTVRNLLSGLRTSVSAALEDAVGDFSLLAEVGVSSMRDGALAFDRGKLDQALAADEDGVAALFAGGGSAGGVFDRLHDYLTGVTQPGGLLDVRTRSVTQQVDLLQDRIDAGERQVDAYEQNLRATFTNLELLVSRLQSQSSFLLGALGRTS